MNKSDHQVFVRTWLIAHESSASNKQPSSDVVNYVFEALFDYSINSIVSAIKLHGKQSRFAPTTADIIKILNIGNKRLSADEAWGLCPHSEDDTVCWTRDMAKAHTAASELIDSGDKVAGRMAFKAAYTRICEQAELEGEPVHWLMSLGFDRDQREPAIKRAVEDGLISYSQGQKLLPSSMEAGPIGKLLTGKTVNLDEIKNKNAMDQLKKIKDMLNKKPVISHEQS